MVRPMVAAALGFGGIDQINLLNTDPTERDHALAQAHLGLPSEQEPYNLGSAGVTLSA